VKVKPTENEKGSVLTRKTKGKAKGYATILEVGEGIFPGKSSGFVDQVQVEILASATPTQHVLGSFCT
jgi:hypothetical protein